VSAVQGIPIADTHAEYAPAYSTLSRLETVPGRVLELHHDLRTAVKQGEDQYRLNCIERTMAGFPKEYGLEEPPA
jgi:hypothetical protein